MTAPISLRERNSRARGFSSVELLFGLTLIVISASLLIGHVALRYGRDTTERNRVFAFMAAKSVLAEVQAAAAGGQDVQDLDDGGVPYPTLTLDRENANLIGTDDQRADGNFQRGSEWVWWREVQVRPVPGVDQRALRAVAVSVSKRGIDGKTTKVATMTTVVAMPRVGFPTTQMFDLYLLAIENIAAAGVDMASVRPFVESEIADFERRNPGLAIRTHWITKASYGRDPNYLPAIAPSSDAHLYHYPFDAARASAIDGRISVGKTTKNDFDANRNNRPYALADVFNHGRRLPAERALHEARIRQVRDRKRAIAEAKDRGATLPGDLGDMSEEPTLRLFLEDLNTNPDDYRHALILNLHGDVLPMPAIRNYSDAASDPIALPNLRCVTHPERLRTRRDPTGKDHDPVVFRVYAYSDDPASLPKNGVCPESHAIALRVMGVDLTDPKRRGVLREGVALENLYGGVPLVEAGTGRRDDTDYRPFAPAKDIYQRRDENEMFYFAQFIDPGFGEVKHTLIWLFHTPVTSPKHRNSGSFELDRIVARGKPAPSSDREPIRELPRPVRSPRTSVWMESDPNKDKWQGLATDARLYGLEYDPSPGERDLATPGSGPKNTARWRLRLTGKVFQEQRFVTASGDYRNPKADVRIDVKTSLWKVGRPESTRSSTTYAWWAAGADAVPVTERAQFLGDPRHSPYADIATGGGDFTDGYNSYFGTPIGIERYPAIDRDRLVDDGSGFDVPRYLALLRGGLLRSGASFATTGTFGGARVLLGGEAPDGRPRLARRNHGGDFWWSRPWLGELRPDGPHVARGNLRAGRSLAEFSLVPAADLLAEYVRRSAPKDSVSFAWQSFFNAELSGRAFGTGDFGGPADPTDVALAIARHYRTGDPPSLDAPGTYGWQPIVWAPEWNQLRYRVSRCRALAVRTYYTGANTNPVAGLVELVRERDHARIVVDRLGGDATDRVRRSLRGLIDARASAGDDLPPRLRLLAPSESDARTDPQSLTLRWEIRAERWDGGIHAAARSAEDAEAVPLESELEYVVLYSRDVGRSWRHAKDDAPAYPGRRPTAGHLLADKGTGPEQWVCPTPASRYPSGSYLWRVEVYAKGRAWHGAHHERRVEIVRRP